MYQEPNIFADIVGSGKTFLLGNETVSKRRNDSVDENVLTRSVRSASDSSDLDGRFCILP